MSLFEISSIRRTEETAKNAAQLPALTLAYIGDTVYDLFVRTMLVETMDANAHKLHLAATGYVRAAAQAAAFRRIEPLLSEEESREFHRGRNAHSGSVPKNASVTDYRTATGLETLIGYLYCTNRDDRIRELMTIILNDEV